MIGSTFPKSAKEALDFLSTPSPNSEDLPTVKVCKRILKDSAKKGELSKEQRKEVLSFLSKTRPRRLENAPQFRNFSVCPTRILFRSPRLWEFLCHPEKHPKESELLSALSEGAFKKLLAFAENLSTDNFPLDEHAEVLRVLTLLDISELKQILRHKLYEKICALEEKGKGVSNEGDFPLHALHPLATVWPEEKSEFFSKLILNAGVSFPKSTSCQELAKEYSDFCHLIKEPESNLWQKLSPFEQHRFFIFLQGKIKIPSLQLKLLDSLLNLLKTGSLHVDCIDSLYEYTKSSPELFKRFKMDSLEIELEYLGGAVKVPLWPLVAKSGYFRSLITLAADKACLKGIAAKHFLLFHKVWMGEKEIGAHSLNFDTLLELLETTSLLKPREFHQVLDEITKAIIPQIKEEHFPRLAKIVCTVSAPKLEAHFIECLNKSPYISVQKEGQGYAVVIKFSQHPPLLALKSSLEVFKIFNHYKRLPEPKEYWPQKEWSEGLTLLGRLFSREQLGFGSQELLSTPWKLEGEKETSSKWDEPNCWTPCDVISLLCELTDESLTPILHSLTQETYHSFFWQYVQNHTHGKSAASLRKESAHFKKIVLDQTGKEMLGLSAEELPRLLPFFLQAERRTEQQLRSLSKVIAKCIKEKTLDLDSLLRALQVCERFYSRKAASLHTLEVEVEYPDGNSILLPLHLLWKMTGSRELFSNGKIGKTFEEIPIESAEWAAQFIESVIEGKAKEFIEEDAQNVIASDFRALQLLNLGEFGYDLEPIKKQMNRFSDYTVHELSEEALLAAVSWAASIGSFECIQSCLDVHSKGNFQLPKGEDPRYLIESFSSKPLKFLKATGSLIQSLEIHLQAAATFENWQEVCEACPHLKKLYLSLRGKETSFETLPWEELPHLEKLMIQPKDAECWESLKQLKIPQTLSTVQVDVFIDQIEKSAPYEFFDNLPAQGVIFNFHTLTSQESVLKTLSSKVRDPHKQSCETLFSHLNHCTELNITVKNADCTKYMTSNQNLEKLILDYSQCCLSVQELKSLLERLPNLKELEISFVAKESHKKLREELERFLSERKKENKNTPNIKITWK